METNTSTKKLTILVVEDHGSLCEMLSLYFMRYGYHVRTADNGETALEIHVQREDPSRAVGFDVTATRWLCGA